jgi:L-seryl-tRNA(Ser) seleniumtransferase
VKVVEVNSPAEVQAAIGPRTAMVEVLGSHFGGTKLDLKDVAPIAVKAGVPILVDAAADYLIVPNPYLALGASLVAYSGGKIIRGPQTAGLLVGRRDLVRAWAKRAAPRSAGRWRARKSCGHVARRRGLADRARIPGGFPRVDFLVRAHHRRITRPGSARGGSRPARGGPTTLSVSWDTEKLAESGRSGAVAERKAAHHVPCGGRRPRVPDPAGGDEARRV